MNGNFRGGISFFIVLAGLVSLALYLAVIPSSQIYGRVYPRQPFASEDMKVALTFDDGPNEPYTSRVLDTLSTYGVKATFFLVGENAAFYPETARRIVEDGHSVGNHSYTHSRLIPFKFGRGLEGEIDRTEELIFRLTGHRTKLFRPPYCFRTPWLLSYVRRKGYITVTWDVTIDDYVPERGSDEIVRAILGKVRPGSIILLHDGITTNHGACRDNMVGALGRIIGELLKGGYRFVTIPELLGFRMVGPRPDFPSEDLRLYLVLSGRTSSAIPFPEHHTWPAGRWPGDRNRSEDRVSYSVGRTGSMSALGCFGPI